MWEADGDGAFTITIAAMSLSNDGVFAGFITIVTEVSIDESGNGFSGELSFEATDEAGEPLATGGGQIEGQRVGSAKPAPVEPDATPVANGTTPSTTTVTILDFAFDPAEIEVATGTTVTWVNEDAAPHTATADDGRFDTGRLEEGGEVSISFEQPGRFAYHCDFHPEMVGGITVTQTRFTALEIRTSRSSDPGTSLVPLTAQASVVGEDEPRLTSGQNRALWAHNWTIQWERSDRVKEDL
jgi:plastocyanin